MKIRKWALILVVLSTLSCSEQEVAPKVEPLLTVLVSEDYFNGLSNYLLVSKPDNSLVEAVELVPGTTITVNKPVGWNENYFNIHFIRNDGSSFVDVRSEINYQSDSIKFGFGNGAFKKGPYLGRVFINYEPGYYEPGSDGSWLIHAGTFYDYQPIGQSAEINPFEFYANANSIFFYRRGTGLPNAYFFRLNFIPDNDILFISESMLRPLSELPNFRIDPISGFYISGISLTGRLKKRDGYPQLDLNIFKKEGFSLSPVWIYYPTHETMEGYELEVRYTGLLPNQQTYVSRIFSQNTPVVPEPMNCVISVLNGIPGEVELSIEGEYDGFVYDYKQSLNNATVWWSVEAKELNLNYSTLPEIPDSMPSVKALFKAENLIPQNSTAWSTIRVYKTTDLSYFETSKRLLE